MPQQRSVCAVVLVYVLTIWTPTVRSEANGAASPIAPHVAGEIVELTNVERIAQGRAQLRANSRLMRAAQIHAEQMARVGQMGHVLTDVVYPGVKDRLAAAEYRWQSYGENVALGQPSAASAVDDWMNSRGHRTNILNAGFTELGAGYATDRSGRPYYVQVFGNPVY